MSNQKVLDQVQVHVHNAMRELEDLYSTLDDKEKFAVYHDLYRDLNCIWLRLEVPIASETQVECNGSAKGEA